MPLVSSYKDRREDKHECKSYKELVQVQAQALHVQGTGVKLAAVTLVPAEVGGGVESADCSGGLADDDGLYT